jgi:adenylate cyclase
MQPDKVERRLAAILHADVQGYSRLLSEDEPTTLRLLSSHLELMQTLVHQHGGRPVGSRGDSLLAEFPSVVEAVQCAVEIQRELKRRNAEIPAERKVAFRIGINLGEIVVEGGQLHGEGINVAVRIEGLAEAGGICISEVVYDQIKSRLPLRYEDLGEHQLKNIAKPVRVYRVLIEESESAKGKGESSKSRRISTSVIVSVGVLVVVLGGMAAVRYVSLPILSPQSPTPTPQPLPLPDKPSIAVLPFINMSGDPEQEYFSDGITEDITSNLSKISNLFVIARNSAFTYKGKTVKVQEVSRELGVRYVLEGSVRRADSQVRITAQLIDATTGGHVWSERYDRPLTDIFTVQDEVTQQIVANLQVEVLEAEIERVRRVPTENLTAYDSLLRGREYTYRFTKEANTQARQMYEQAIALDPQYAGAYVAVGWTYWVEWTLQWSDDPQSLERAAELAQRAITLNASLPAAHRLLSHVLLWKNRQHDLAIAEGERALALDPNNPEGYTTLANILTFAGRPEEAIVLLEKGMRLNPRAPHYWFYLFELGHAYHWLGQYEKAIDLQKRVLLLNPNQYIAHLELAKIYHELGREEEARAEVAEAVKLNPHYSLEALRERHPYKDPAALERYLVALRKAGLK